MAGCVKLFRSILTSTLWCEPPTTKLVWLTMMMLADKDGIVEARAPGIARAAGVTRAECDRALACFAAPDPDSRTKDHDGKRAEECDEGWRILNYEEYLSRLSADDAAAKNAARQARFRARTEKRNARNAPRDVTSNAGNGSNDKEEGIRNQDPGSGRMDPESQAREISDARASGETWATVLRRLRTIHGRDCYDPTQGGAHREALEWIAARPAAEIARVLEHYAADEWAKKNPGRANPKHIRGSWDKYLDGPTKHVEQAGAKVPIKAKTAAEYDHAGGAAPWDL